MKYKDFISEANKLYYGGKDAEAYQYVTDYKDNFKEFGGHIYNFRYCTACKSGQAELAISLMKEAVLDLGYWYSYDYLLQDEDLKAIWDRAEFKELAKICRQRELEAKESATSDELLVFPDNFNHDEKYPLMIGLHGNGQNMSISKENWVSDITRNFVLAFEQSSQPTFSGAYVWNDYKKGCEDIKIHYQKLMSEKYIDGENVIICGFSAGTRTSLYSILSGSVNVKGYIFNGSWLPELDEWEPMLQVLKDKGIKGYIICGDKDEVSLESTEKFTEMLEKRGISYIVRYVKDTRHEFPKDFDIYLKEAIDFIM